MTRVDVAHIDLKVLSPVVLQVVARRLERTLGGAFHFENHGATLRASVDMNKLLPSCPGLSLTDVLVKDGELLLKAGKA